MDRGRGGVIELPPWRGEGLSVGGSTSPELGTVQKQNLKIKTFIGTSANAIKVQVWTALITILILKYLQMRAQIGWSLSNLVALLRMNLFTQKDLWAWLNKPFEEPLSLWEAPNQEALRFA